MRQSRSRLSILWFCTLSSLSIVQSILFYPIVGILPAIIHAVIILCGVLEFFSAGQLADENRQLREDNWRLRQGLGAGATLKGLQLQASLEEENRQFRADLEKS